MESFARGFGMDFASEKIEIDARVRHGAERATTGSFADFCQIGKGRLGAGPLEDGLGFIAAAEFSEGAQDVRSFVLSHS